MSEKSEDVRLMVGNVRHKKSDGALYLMGERLAWMPNGRDQFTISHKYSDIKMQKISPEGKPKIQLQIVLHSGDATTFQFVNSEGAESQLEDRRNVKDALLTLLPQFKGKIPKDRERKAKILSENPHLLQLYKDLVEVKVITADEFWQQFASDKEDDSMNGISFSNGNQQIGVSPGFLAEIKPQSSLDGSLKYNVNVETLQAIFRTYPNVAKKHRECVPTKMTESEFWSKFFQSQYFHRDRLGSIKDMFSDCTKMDEKDWSKTVKAGINDPYLDLSAFDDHPYKNDGYGNSSANDNQTGKKDSITESANHTLIKSFNQHSIKVLESCVQKEKKTSSQITTTSTNGSTQSQEPTNGSSKVVPMDEDECEATFRSKRRQWNYEDLEENDGKIITGAHGHNSNLNIACKDRYSIAPTVSDDSSISANVIVQRHLEQIANWTPKLSECISSEEAVKALGELSPNGLLMRTVNVDRLSDTVSEEIQEAIKSTYYASNELLRHFWLCFPVVGQNLEKKLEKMDETLSKFEKSKLQPFKQRLSRDHDNLINHILIQFQLAHQKYEDWKEKKRRSGLMLRGGLK